MENESSISLGGTIIALLTLREQIKVELSEIQLNHFYATTLYQQLLKS